MKVKTLLYDTYWEPQTVFAAWPQGLDLAFLDSAAGYDTLGRWAILAFDPWLRLRAFPDHLCLNDQCLNQDPFAVLADILRSHEQPAGGTLPLYGGAVGAIAYEAGWPLVDLPPHWPFAEPWLSFDFCDRFLLFDRHQRKLYLQACGKNAPAETALAQMQAFLKTLGKPRAIPPVEGRILTLPAAQPYQAAVQALRRDIAQGEIYIANYTDRIHAQSQSDGRDLFLHMQRQNPAPFAAYLKQDKVELLSSSPERFLKVEHRGQSLQVTTRPIKGTRPRRRSISEDEAMRRQLAASEKDRSELLMIVDLERNDLSRVCTPDSVTVKELFAIESFPTVHHLVATVSGRLEPNRSAVDALSVCFPGGSITGAPKRRAMQKIAALEKEARGYYTGCLGYFSADGQADFSILIRTMQKRKDQLVYGAGGGITWESDPKAEYQEMLDKTAALQTLFSGGKHAQDR